MSQAHSMEGTWEELAAHADEFRGKRLRLSVIAEENAAAEITPRKGEPQSLADLLGDFIGCIEGNDENYSDDTGRKFTEYLVKKHQENHL